MSLRLLHALVLITSLLLGQVQARHQVYVRQDDGSTCLICPTSPCVGTAYRTSAESADVSKSDCKPCCRLTACGSDHGVKTTAIPPSPAPDFALCAAPFPTLDPTAIIRTVVSVHIESSFPNAPPTESQGRSPPLQLS